MEGPRVFDWTIAITFSICRYRIATLSGTIQFSEALFRIFEHCPETKNLRAIQICADALNKDGFSSDFSRARASRNYIEYTYTIYCDRKFHTYNQHITPFSDFVLNFSFVEKQLEINANGSPILYFWNFSPRVRIAPSFISSIILSMESISIFHVKHTKTNLNMHPIDWTWQENSEEEADWKEKERRSWHFARCSRPYLSSISFRLDGVCARVRALSRNAISSKFFVRHIERK